jgi:hypothetical protein
MKWNSFLCKKCVYYIGFGNMKGRRLECNCSYCFDKIANSYDENEAEYGDNFYEKIDEIINKIIINNTEN